MTADERRERMHGLVLGACRRVIEKACREDFRRAPPKEVIEQLSLDVAKALEGANWPPELDAMTDDAIVNGLDVLEACLLRGLADMRPS